MINASDMISSDCSNSIDRAKRLVEQRLIAAAWTLRRMPDREKGYLNAGKALWPEYTPEKGRDYVAPITVFETRKAIRPSAKEIDDMQPAFDMLMMLRDVSDRRLVFWASWHQNGESLDRIPWSKVRASMASSLTRWTMKRRYDSALEELVFMHAYSEA